MADRVRAQNVAMDVTPLSQGVPFFHAGVDMLRSKSFDRDSFNSGDWFNSLDFSYETTNYGVGLPVAEKNESDWYLIAPRLADPALAPDDDRGRGVGRRIFGRSSRCARARRCSACRRPPRSRRAWRSTTPARTRSRA